MADTNTQDQLLASLIADMTRNQGSPAGRIDAMQLLAKAVPQFMEGVAQRGQDLAEVKTELRRVNARLKVLYGMFKRQGERLNSIDDVHGQLETLTEVVMSIGAIFEHSQWEFEDDAPVGRRGVDPGDYQEPPRERYVTERGVAPSSLRYPERHMMNHRRNAER
jgi:hypothetical protein